MTMQSVAMLAQIFQVLTLTCPLNTWTAQIMMAEPAHKKTKCERTFLYTPQSVNTWLEIDMGPDLPSLRSTQTLVRHKSCASTELDTDTERDVSEDEKGNEDQKKKKKEADELVELRVWRQLQFECEWRAKHDKYISNNEWMAFLST